jgi:hypothetical protein
MAGHDTYRWAGVVDDLARTDRRPVRTIETRLAATVHELGSDWARSHPLTRRRLAGIAARDALALYLAAGGDDTYLAGIVRLLGVVGDGRPTAGTLADRATVGRRIIATHRSPRSPADEQRLADCLLLAAALDQPDPTAGHVHAPRAPDVLAAVPDTVRDVAHRIGVTLDDHAPAHA